MKINFLKGENRSTMPRRRRKAPPHKRRREGRKQHHPKERGRRRLSRNADDGTLVPAHAIEQGCKYSQFSAVDKMFTTTHLTTTTTSMTTRLPDDTNHKGLALCGHTILPGCDCKLVGPGQYSRYTSAVKDGRPWVAKKHHTRLRADARLSYFQS